MSPPNGFEAYLRAVGVPVFETASARWYADSRVSLLSCPPDTAVAPSAKEVRDLILRARRPIVRYISAAPDAARWERIVCHDRSYALSLLSPKARNQTRRGLEKAVVRDVSRSELLDQGLPLARSTWSRQGRRPRINAQAWSRVCDAVDAGVARAWGAFAGDRELGSLAITVDDGPIRHIVFQASSTGGLARHASNALVFELTRRSLTLGECAEVSYGLRGFVRDDALDHFKLGMGYQLEAIGLRVVMPPGLRAPLRLCARPPLSLLLRLVSADLPRKLETLLAIP